METDPYAVDMADLMPVPPPGMEVRMQRRNKTPKEGEKTTYVRSQDLKDLDAARARNEELKADLNELKLKQESGEWINRAAVKQAAATAIQAFSQSMRSIPDQLERNLGVSPDVAEEVSRYIDEALNALADDLQMMTGN